MSGFCPRCDQPYPEGISHTEHKVACFEENMTPEQREEWRAYRRADKQRRNAWRDERKRQARQA